MSLQRPSKIRAGLYRPSRSPPVLFPSTWLGEVPLPGLPWSPEFMAVYNTALAETAMPLPSALPDGIEARRCAACGGPMPTAWWHGNRRLCSDEVL